MAVARPLTGYHSLVENPAADTSAPACCALALDWISQWAMAVSVPAAVLTGVGAKIGAAVTADAPASAASVATIRTG